MRRGAIILAAFSVACTGTQTSPDPDLLKGRTGMGIVVYVDATGDWIVRGLLPNSPAERAGIQVGDRLLSIAGIRLGARSDDGRQATRAGGFARVEEALSSTRFVEVAIERDGPVSVSLEPSSLFDMVIDHSSGNARGDASDNGRGGLSTTASDLGLRPMAGWTAREPPRDGAGESKSDSGEAVWVVTLRPRCRSVRVPTTLWPREKNAESARR